jgi:NAD(P)-dependent dehydrogenase (short-subunit alcohol dehydrogenase family)
VTDDEGETGMNDPQTVPSEVNARLTGQVVVIIGGSSGIGRATAGQARAAGADVIITGRDPDRLQQAGAEVGALRTAQLDLSDPAGLEQFFAGLPAPIDHVLATGGGPIYTPIADLDFDQALRVFDEHLLGALRLARVSATRVRPGGSLTFITGTDARRPGVGSSVAAILAAALPTIAANVAVELAPIRANAVAAGYVDTPLSARILGDDLEHRRAELRAALPIRRVVGPEDLAALVLHLMTNSAVTGATFDIDGGQQLLA